jgi:solute carrier family 50 protein (sugar transporter)
MQFSCPLLQKKSLKLLGAMMVSFILVAVIILEVVHDKHRRKLIIGVFCAVFSVGMYACPLTVMVDPHYYTPSPIPFLPSE